MSSIRLFQKALSLISCYEHDFSLKRKKKTFRKNCLAADKPLEMHNLLFEEKLKKEKENVKKKFYTESIGFNSPFFSNGFISPPL